MDELDSSDQLLYPGVDYNFVQVVYLQNGQELRPHIKLDGSDFEIYGYQKFRRDRHHPFKRLELIPNGGRVIVLVGESFEEAETVMPAPPYPTGTVNAKDFGAIGDGVVDDTFSLRAAIAAAVAVHGIVWIPPGRYRITDTLLIDVGQRVDIRGAGWGDPTDAGAPAGTTIVRDADVIVFRLAGSATVVSDLAITATTFGTADGITIGEADATNGAARVTLRNISVTKVGGSGVSLKNGNGIRIDNLQVLQNRGHGLNIDSLQTAGIGPNTNACTITNVRAINNLGDGIHLGAAQANFLLGFNSEGNTGFGVYLNNVYNTVIGYVEANTAGPLKADANAFGNFIVLRNVNGDPTMTNDLNWLFNQGGVLNVEDHPVLRRRGGLQLRGPLSHRREFINYGPTPTFNANVYSTGILLVTDAVAFTMQTPTAPLAAGQEIRIIIANQTAGAIGAVTWPVTTFSLAGGGGWVQPVAGFYRWIQFLYVGSNRWVELARSTADTQSPAVWG